MRAIENLLNAITLRKKFFIPKQNCFKVVVRKKGLWGKKFFYDFKS